MFNKGKWTKDINVKNFIQLNYKKYTKDDSFLEDSSQRTKTLWNKCEKYLKKELNNGIYKVDTENISGIDNFSPGYIDRKNELIVGLQSDEPLKRIINPFGGIRMVTGALDQYGIQTPEILKPFLSDLVKTHNDGVYDVYTKQMRKARKCGLLTGLPDAYGRGRLIGDYRRIALYGIDYLIKMKKKDKEDIQSFDLEKKILKSENLKKQIEALEAIKNMASSYDYDISEPAKNAKEAVQHVYFGYLASVKENNGAAMSLGRVSTFLDIYFEKDLKEGTITEKDAQEIIDDFVIKLRLVRHLRTKEYNELFAGDPTWITESIAGLTKDESVLVTKTSFRFLNTLNTLGPAPEPNMTVLWSSKLPQGFKEFCAKLSIETGSIQYENDDIMRPIYGDDYSIACCVSPMSTGKESQYFGARCNLPKALLMSLNGGIDEIKDIKVFDNIKKVNSKKALVFEVVLEKYKEVLSRVAKLYVDTMNVIHYMHDKYAYEASQLALHDSEIKRNMAFGVAGLSVIADSLSAIKYAKVYPIYEDGLIKDFEIEGDFPKYGNNDDRVDQIGIDILKYFISELRKHNIYNDAKPTLSVLTITSNVVYGKKTGSTPDGRKQGEPFAPGANPMHGRDSNGALASLKSVAKIPFENVCEDGISNTMTITPKSLGKTKEQRMTNLVNILDGYFLDNAHHLNVNVLDRKKLIDAQKNPEKYPNLTIRVSGYAVNFNRLNKEQQNEVISRTFHKKV
ncbi:MAG: formate C-acetyltransferase [Bacillota bacterium]